MSGQAADVAGKVVLITGGAQGIGGGAAQLCAERGAEVIITDINQDKGKALAQSLGDQGYKAIFMQLDVSNADDVENTFQKVNEIYGRLDVLICAAGVLLGPMLQPEEFPVETFDTVMDINVKGCFLCTKFATPLLVNSDNGVIVLVASGAGVIGGSSSIAYGTSKGAVNGMGFVLENHLAPRGIRVNVICPGSVETELKLKQMREAAEYQGQTWNKEDAARRLGDPLGVSQIIAFLASDDAAYVKRNMFTR